MKFPSFHLFGASHRALFPLDNPSRPAYSTIMHKAFKVMKNSLLLLCLSLVITVLGCATAQNTSMLRARAGLNDQRYEYTLKRLAEAEAFADTSPALKAEIAYMKGVCYERLGRHSDAIGMFRYTNEQFPSSQFAYQAREHLNKLSPPAN